jgi:LacI family transcriptional regulator
MKPTIRDVAKMAEVSISTVSRVMNAPESVVESKRSRVLEAIQDLKYQPNALARGLIYKKSNTLGVMIPDVRNPYYGNVIRGMEDAAKKLGYNLMICNTDHDKKRLISYLRSFYEKQIDGIVFTSDFMYPDYYEAIQRYMLPVVLVSTQSYDYELPSVNINDEQGGYDATKYLIELGHKKIGMVCFSLTDSMSGLSRYRGFLRALREFDLERSCGRCVEFAGYWFDDAEEAAGHLFAKHPDLTAVFAVSDEFAMGIISYLHSRNTAVPDQVSVVGFDDIRMARMTIPKLTTIAQPMYELGHRGIEKLHEIIEGGESAELREIMPHRLIVRDSSRPGPG